MSKYICKYCGYEGEGKRQLRGSKGIEMFLWTTLVIPGPFYTFWRMTGKSKACPNCERPGFVKSSSDEGYIVKKKLEKELGKVEVKKADTSQIQSFGREVSQFEEVKQKRKVDPDQF